METKTKKGATAAKTTTAIKKASPATAKATGSTKTAPTKTMAAPKTNGTAKTPATAKKVTVKPKKNAAEALRDLFNDGLKDIYWAEKALTKALPKMAKNATTPNLVEAINSHLEETKNQVTRLEKVFEMVGQKAVAKKCDAMEGLIREGEGIMEETDPGAVRDAGIIAAAQKIEHYEIASYGTLAAFARILNEDDAAALLKQTLVEEKEADATLTEAAFNNINFDAR